MQSFLECEGAGIRERRFEVVDEDGRERGRRHGRSGARVLSRLTNIMMNASGLNMVIIQCGNNLGATMLMLFTS
jgi:hypothetical protein